MYKKLMLACMAIAAFSAIAASSASAAVLTHPTGTVASAGIGIKATNVGESHFVSSLGNITCNNNTMAGTLHSNSTAGGVTGEITSASFKGSAAGEECTGTGTRTTNVTVTGLPWCVKSLTGDNFEVRGGACTSAPSNITFTLDVTGLANCSYAKTSIAGTATTDTTGDAILSISNVEVQKTGGILCPSPGELTMSFTLETNSVTTEPVYLSE